MTTQFLSCLALLTVLGYLRRPVREQGRTVVNKRYSQVTLLRTIEDILGTEHINLNTAFAEPITEVFDIRLAGVDLRRRGFDGARDDHGGQSEQSGTALRQGTDRHARVRCGQLRQVTAAFYFSEDDQVPVARFNRLLWAGLKGDAPYPALRDARGMICRRTWPGCSGGNRRVSCPAAVGCASNPGRRTS